MSESCYITMKDTEMHYVQQTPSFGTTNVFCVP
jgi:hypothetical protein